MQLYYIRHGQSTNNELYWRTGADVGRSHDPELTAVGRKQAERLAEFLCTSHTEVVTDHHDSQNRAGFHITHLYSSLMVRAVSTGMILANRLGLPLHAWVDWHEEGGIYRTDEATGEHIGLPGYDRAYFTEHYPALVVPETLGDAGWWTHPGQEPAAARLERARRVLAELLERHGGTDDRVAIVSHGGFYNHFLAALNSAPERLPVYHLLNNCSLSRIDFPPDRSPFVVYENRLEYLPAELVTL